MSDASDDLREIADLLEVLAENPGGMCRCPPRRPRPRTKGGARALAAVKRYAAGVFERLERSRSVASDLADRRYQLEAQIEEARRESASMTAQVTRLERELEEARNAPLDLELERYRGGER